MKAQIPGEIAKAVTLYCDDPHQPIVEIPVTGRVVETAEVKMMAGGTVAATPSVGCYEFGSVLPPAAEWDSPGATGGINGLDDGKGGKCVSFTSVSLADGALAVGFEAARVDADGETFALVCKEKLTDETTFTIDVTLTDDGTGSATLGSLEGLTDKPSLFIFGIAPATAE